MSPAPDELAARITAAIPTIDATTASAMADAVRSARRAWPDVVVPAETFAAHVVERAPDGAIDDLHLDDLYLACALTYGDATAVATFEREVLAPAAAGVRGPGIAPEVVDEVLQRGRVLMLVRGTNARARIEDYGGRGSLAGWLRVVLRRLRLEVQRERADVAGEDAPPNHERANESVPAAEVGLLKDRYGAWFGGAVRRALATLEPNEAKLVRMHFRDGRSLAAIGRALGVHKSTISRQLTAARARVLEALLRLGRAELGVSEAELQSLMRVVRSQIRITLVGALTPPASP